MVIYEIYMRIIFKWVIIYLCISSRTYLSTYTLIPVELRHSCRISRLKSCLNERYGTTCRLHMEWIVKKYHVVVWNHKQITLWKVSETNESWRNLSYISTRFQFPPLQHFNIHVVKKIVAHVAEFAPLLLFHSRKKKMDLLVVYVCINIYLKPDMKRIQVQRNLYFTWCLL